MISLPLLLAIACTAEIDFGPTKLEAQWNRECQVQWAILDAQSVETGRSLEDIVRHYISALVCEGKRCDTPRARMIRSMGEAGSEPQGWDERAGNWNRQYRWRWMRRLARARAFVEAVEVRRIPKRWQDATLFFPWGVPLSCRMARHFGGACSATGACDAVPACWKWVDCGPTQQAYWIPKTCSAGAGVIDAVTASARR
jgi:hypothetical protein